MPPLKLETLLFDLDGTLVDSRADLTNAVNHALKITGLPEQSQESIVPHVGNGLRILLNEVMGPVPDDVLEKAIKAFSVFYDAHCVDHTTLYGNVLTCLEELSPKFRLGVVTNKPEGFARKIINELGAGGLLPVVVGGDSLVEKKPHPAPVLKAIKDLGGESESTLILGDGAQDILAGQAAGCATCAAQYGYGYKPDLLDLKPDFKITDFNGLKEIVL